MTAHHWRTVRLKLALAGISDPMALPTAHMLLDLVEHLILESFASNKPAEEEAKRDQFYNALYRPPPETLKAMGSGHKPIPAGFDPENVDDAFDAAVASLSGAPR